MLLPYEAAMFILRGLNEFSVGRGAATLLMRWGDCKCE